MTNQEKRKNYPMQESDMYNMSDLEKFIAKERRRDELDRLNEVMQQKKVWKRTVSFALFLIFVLLVLSWVGYANGIK